LGENVLTYVVVKGEHKLIFGENIVGISVKGGRLAVKKVSKSLLYKWNKNVCINFSSLLMLLSIENSSLEIYL
jgi:hypothetical protein